MSRLFSLTGKETGFFTFQTIFYLPDINEYQKALEYGISDPDSTVEERNERMIAAGLQDIIDEKQRQLDEFLPYQRNFSRSLS